MVKSKGVLIEGAFGSHHTATNNTDHSLDLGVDFTEGGKPENLEKNPRSTGETNYNNSTHMSSTFFENQHEAIPMQVVTHPAITPSDRA